MAAEESGLPPEPSDVRPLVASRSSNRAVLLFASIATLAAGLLFYTLESRRTASKLVDVSVPANRSSDIISSPPPLTIPPDYGSEVPEASLPQMALQSTGRGLVRDTPVIRRSLPAATYAPGTEIQPMLQRRSPPAFSDSGATNYGDSPAPAVVLNPVPPNLANASGTTSGGNQAERVMAKPFQNPSTTLPKGSVIQAVLETALDSTRAGFARAIVSRDTFGFDGSQVLIPRGSRLVGEYKADLATGQKRALIQWQRLMRPDGATIDLESPAADPLGRAGVGGKVNSHFFERFSGAILQSTLDIGVQLATRSVSRDSVVVALPGSLQGVTTVQPDKIQPTLKVRQGTRISVFVSRDLDFTTVNQ